MEITKENIEEHGWKLTSESWEPWPTWSKEAGRFFLDLTYGVSNMAGRDWTLHVDNMARDTVATLDVGTYEQIEGLLDLLNP